MASFFAKLNRISAKHGVYVLALLRLISNMHCIFAHTNKMFYKMKKRVLLLLALLVVGIGATWAQNNPFMATWTSDAEGKIFLPVKGANWKLEVLKGANVVKEATVTSSDENANIYVVDGLEKGKPYTVKIYPAGVEYIRCGTDKAQETAKRLLRIQDWGDIKWTTMERAFAGCANLTSANSGVPNLSGVTSCKEVFKGCTALTLSPNNWNMENVEDMENMFDGCQYYDFTMENWMLAKAKKISFGEVKKFSLKNYEKTLIGWAKNAKTASGVVFNANKLLYSSEEAKAARDKLVNEKGWTITGDKYILFKFKQPLYYCKKENTINVEIEAAEGIDKSQIKYSVPGEYEDGYNVIKVEDQGSAKIKGLKDGEAVLTAKVKYDGMDLKATCKVVVNEKGEASTYKLNLKQSGTGTGALNVRKKENGEKLALGEHTLPEGTVLLVNVDYNKSLASLELKIDGENKTSSIDYGDHKLTLDKDYTIEAVLTEIKQWKVEFAAAQNGTMRVQGKDGAQLEAGKENKTPDGTLVIVSFNPAAEHVLEEFRINKKAEAVTGNTHSFTLDKDVVLEAFFSKADERSVVLEIAGGATNGSVMVGDKPLAAGINKVAKDSKQKVTVKPNEGYRVKSFTIAGENKLAEAEAGVEVTFDKVVDIAVAFEEETTKIHVNWTAPEAAQGTLTVRNHKDGAVNSGEEVLIHTTIKVEVVPNKEYNLVELKANNDDLLPTKKGNVYTYTVGTTDVTLTYRFEKKPVLETVKVRFTAPAATEGTLTVTDADGKAVANEGEVKKNTTITIKAAPAAGYTLKRLTANGNDLKPKYDKKTHSVAFAVQEEDVTIAVEFEKSSSVPSEEDVEVTLTVTGELNGKVKVGEKELVSGVNKVKKGETLKVTAKANDGFQLKTFTIDGVDRLAEAETGIAIAFKQAVAIAVEFKTIAEGGDEKVTLKIVQPQDGAIVVKASDGKVLENGAKIEKSTITITATPSAQYELEWLKANEEDLTTKVDKKTHSVQYEVKADVTIRAKFKKRNGGERPTPPIAPPPTGVEDALFANVMVAPNPFTSQLRIVNPEGVVGRYTLVNTLGVVVRSGALSGTEVFVDTEALPAGIYFVCIKIQGGAKRSIMAIKHE